jgi:hypothetical protein
MFRKADDFEAFQRVMVEAHERQPIADEMTNSQRVDSGNAKRKRT